MSQITYLLNEAILIRRTCRLLRAPNHVPGSGIKNRPANGFVTNAVLIERAVSC